MSEKFKKPDAEQDSGFIQDEESRSGGSGESIYDTQYKPEKSLKGKPQVINKIRILAAKGSSEGTYYLRIGRHFIKHNDRTEMFICPKETADEPCPACEAYADLKDKGDNSADKYKPQIRGVMNVLSRGIGAEATNPDSTKVQLYFSPIQAICTRVVRLVRGQGPMSDIFDEFDDNFKVTKPGRDMILIYNPQADPQDMYMIYPGDLTPAGTPKQVEDWYSQMRDLTVEGVFGSLISYEDAAIKMYGSADERQALRDRWQQEAQQRQAAQQSESKPEPAKEEPKPEPVKEEPKPDPKDELKVADKSKAEEDVEAKIKRQIASASAAQKAAKKG